MGDFRKAVEARDIDAMMACLTDDVRLHSPVAHTPFEGADAVRALFTALIEHAFEDFRYTDELKADGVESLIFRARVGDREVEGIDILRYDDDGKVYDFTVMVRPMSGLNALFEAVAPHVTK